MHIYFLKIIALAVCLFGSLVAANDESICSWDEFELPIKWDWVEPVVYRIELDVLMREPWTVSGVSEIDVVVNQPTKCVVLNSVGINISEASATEFGPADLSFNQQEGQVTLLFESPLSAGNHTLRFRFTYETQRTLDGFYRSIYTVDGVEKIIALTQFEVMAARKAFPCFDQPNMRSEFELSVVADEEYTVLSNMPTMKVVEVRSVV